MNYLTRFFASVCTLSLCTVSAYAADDLSHISQFINKVKADTKFQSATAVAVVKDGKIIYQDYFGYADINAKQRANDKTAFYIASATKPFFALSSLLLENKGDIKESTSMKQMFPSLKFKDINAEQVTLKHLLSHTGGIDNQEIVTATAYTGIHDNALRHTLVGATVKNKKTKLNEYDYSNVGYNIVSVWFDNFYKQDWQKTLAETVFNPLKLEQTSAYMGNNKTRQFDVAHPYSIFNLKQNEPLYLSKQDNTMHAAGGMIASAPNLARFLVAQLNEGKVDGQQVFPAEVIKKSHQKNATLDSEYLGFVRTGYAWGWNIGDYKDEVLYSHFGGFSGASAHLSFMPEHNIGLVVLHNEAFVGTRLTVAISDLVYSTLLNKGDIDKAVTKHGTKIVDRITQIAPLIAQDRKKRSLRKVELSLDNKEYTGTFTNSLVGKVEVTLLPSGEFHVSWGNMKATATAYKRKDTLRVELVPLSGWTINYQIDNGHVTQLNIGDDVFVKEKT